MTSNGTTADNPAALLSAFLDRSSQIVDVIESRLLNVQGKDVSRNPSRASLERALDACFFETAGMAQGASRFNERLAAEPLLSDGEGHRLDPLGLIVRAYAHWERQRWPGRNGRLAFARSLFSLYVLRQLESLSLRIWDGGSEHAWDRLQEVQRLLDRLNGLAGVHALVRDARWLIQTAQGPLTRHIAPYFRIAERIAASLTDPQRLEIHQAGARLAGGHLRSQLRYRAREAGRAIDDAEVLSITRNSNSMDVALLAWDLVPLLDAYRNAHDEVRLDLADAIVQGLSADPELLLTRLDLLAPCTIIEDLFIQHDSDARARYTPLAETHLALLVRYGTLIAELARPLMDDAARLDPTRGVYSPFGMVYGFCADLLSNLAADPLFARASSGFSLEDLFDNGNGDVKLARAREWATLPSRDGEGEHVEYSAEWAQQMFSRTIGALEARAARPSHANASAVPSGRLFVVSRSVPVDSRAADALPEDIVAAQEHCVTADVQRALATGATAFPRSQILLDRGEGRFLASGEADGKWFGVSKVVLTMCTGQGKDAVVADVPEPVVEVMRLTCPGLVVVRDV